MRKTLLRLLSLIFVLCCSLCVFTACNNHSHNFCKKVATKDFIATNATCMQKATYYYSCTCGKKGDKTFISGELSEHCFSNYIYNNDALCEVNGTETATCDFDGCVQTHTKDKVDTALGHLFVPIAYAQPNSDGTIDAICSRTGCKTQSKINYDDERIQSGLVFKTLNPNKINLIDNAASTFSFDNEILLYGNSTFLVAKDEKGETPFNTNTITLDLNKNKFTFYIIEKNYNNIVNIFKIRLYRESATFVVTFNSNGGKVLEGNLVQTVADASEIIKPLVSRKNHHFVGWDTNIDFITDSITVNAVWIENYFLTFDIISDKKLRIYPNQPIGELPTPQIEVDGKEFKYWAIGNEIINENTIWNWTDDKQAKAIYLADNEHWLSIDYNGGYATVSNPDGYTSETPTFTLNNPTRPGYEFLGWQNTDDVGSGIQTTVEISTGSTGTLRYKAIWQAKEYTISFNAQSGEVSAENKQIFSGQEIGTLPTPTNGNVKFLGWYYNDVKVDALDVFDFACDVELVAKWEYKIKFQLWSKANKDTIVYVTVDGGAPQNLTVNSDFTINSALPPVSDVILIDVDTNKFKFYGWTIIDKKYMLFDGSKYGYPEDITVEELMMTLKNGSAEEKLERQKIIESGEIIIIAKTDGPPSSH